MHTGIPEMSFQVPVTIIEHVSQIEQTCLLSPNIVQITSREYGWAMTCWSSFVWGFNSSYQGMKKCTTNHHNIKQVVLAVLWGLTSLKSQHFITKKKRKYSLELECNNNTTGVLPCQNNLPKKKPTRVTKVRKQYIAF